MFYVVLFKCFMWFYVVLNVLCVNFLRGFMWCYLNAFDHNPKSNYKSR